MLNISIPNPTILIDLKLSTKPVSLKINPNIITGIVAIMSRRKNNAFL